MNSILATILAASMAVQSDGMDTSFKSYMGYTCITNEDSTQYKLQQNAWTDTNGLRRYGSLGDYMIAVGTPYGMPGDRVLVTLDTEETLVCIIGDSKGDVWYHDCARGACVVEFIVDTPQLDPTAKEMGDISYIDGMEGQVVSITPLPSYKELRERWVQRNTYEQFINFV